ncbi:proteoglycan 4 [Musca domestica]|uniref:Proteoglycan 4 n=1 Tax=Musca domestica TaxID=7370 RepID=A0ABM3VIN3_MUSDO|nr:proteoglycan 4 [Musca domestica]
MSKSGFSTLNRWLGRKNKDKSMSNGKLSKSSTNLSISSTNINETSQLEYNRITPLPAATTNAPFEQTFRITVLLPKDQLYVTRLGARVPLSKLLDLVCDNKLLDPQKYEFRNPVDASQVYSCDLTIGAVGLSEIRLCHKSESYDNNFNSDEIMKLQRTTIIRESLTSSEFSGRNSKHTAKTTSPYSSTNSLNSMDSSGTRPRSAQPKIAAPPRKKRAAPKPPSQAAIPERGEQNTLATKDFSVSTPNLSSPSSTFSFAQSDINGNKCNGHLAEEEEEEEPEKLDVANKNLSNGYTEDTVLYAQVQKKNALNSNNFNGETGPAGPEVGRLPEPSPRKKVVPVVVVAAKKKTVAPPAPAATRNSLDTDDTESIASSNVNSEPSTPATPKPAERSMSREDLTSDMMPKPQPRVTTTTTMLNTPQEVGADKPRHNVSKVMLNRTPTPEPRSLSCEPPDMDVCYETQLENLKRPIEDDNVSKQADSGIGEPVPSPIPDSLPSEVSHLDVKSNFESSSDDDDMVKVYNFKLGKTLVKPLNETKTLEELTLLNAGQEETDSELNTPLTQVPCSGTPSETSSWNFAIPISPPPNFADGKFAEAAFEPPAPAAEQENPITPKIVERPVLNFEVLKQETTLAEKTKVTTPQTPLQSCVGELSAIIQDNALDSLIKKSEETPEIESAKPNTLSNFSITAGAQTCLTKPKEVQKEGKELQERDGNRGGSDISNGAQMGPEETKKGELDRKELPQREEIRGDVNATQMATVESKEVAKEQDQPSLPEDDKTQRETNTENQLNKISGAQMSPKEQPTELESPTNAPDEEKLYRKRNSVTSLKQRRSVNRSDSFHSTAITTPESGANLGKRTSSQMSLDQMAGNLNRRRSSSELSIGESPSLQSLEVMKTILNSRKNSLEQQELKQDHQAIEVNTRRPSEELKFASLELKTKSHAEEQDKKLWQTTLSGQDSVSNSEDASSEIRESPKPKELPKVYRYSGPPSINFSTWSERPKAQVVAIKNEGDYIFGGKQNGNKTLPSLGQSDAAPIVKTDTIQRMGIPEKEFKVPILVKPLPDVVVDKVEVQAKLKASNNDLPTPIAEKASKPPTPVKNIPNGSLKFTPQRPTVESVLKPQTQSIVNVATLPRSNNKRFTSTAMLSTSSSPTTPPGPQLLRSPSTKREEAAAARDTKSMMVVNENVAPGPQLLRSTSSSGKRVERETKSMVVSANDVTPAPFGQNTLRRTGFKEKILAQEEQQKERHIAQTPTQAKAFTNGELKVTNTNTNSMVKPAATSAKLHLNLKAVNTTTTTTPLSNPSPPLKPKPQTPKTAPVISTTTPPPVPAVGAATTPKAPIPPPMFMSVNLKPVTGERSPLPANHPRDQLMEAIRNFKRNDLKKS